MPERSPFQHRVRDLVKRPLVTVDATASAVEVARCLSREAVGSAVVVGPGGEPAGIVTDRDLRRRIVAEGRDPRTVEAASIMSSPLITISASAFVFEVVLEMTRRHVRHLVVVDDGTPIGVVSTTDLLVLSTTHPVTVAREIDRAASLDVLADLAHRITALVRQLDRKSVV